MRLLEKSFYKFLFFLSEKVFRPTITEIRGIENLPKEKGFIIAANHVNSFDPFIIVAVIKRFLYEHYFKNGKKFYYIGMKGLKKRIYSFFLNEKVGYLSASRDGIKRAAELLENGNVVGIFPEGRRNTSSRMLEGKRGVAYMALLSGAPVVPVACFGPSTRGFNQGLKGLFKPKKVYFGWPIFFSKRNSLYLQEASGFPILVKRIIMSRIAELCGKTYETKN
jgi:1-acyl-sn-glycerol-3-phosphate acyltransferase